MAHSDSSAIPYSAPVLNKLQQQSTTLNQIALRLIAMESLLEKLAGAPSALAARTIANNATHIIPKTPMADVLRESTEFRLLAPAYVPSSVSLPELVILIHLMLQTPARDIFEFGTYIGRTGLNFALNSPADARIHALDMPTEWQAQYSYSAGRFFVKLLLTTRSSKYTAILSKLTSHLISAAWISYSWTLRTPTIMS